MLFHFCMTLTSFMITELSITLAPFTTDLVFWLHRYLFIGLYWELYLDRYSSCRSVGMLFDAAWWTECNSRIRRCICRSFYTFVWSGTLLAIAGFLIFIFGLRPAGCSLVLERHLGPSSRLLILVDLYHENNS